MQQWKHLQNSSISYEKQRQAKPREARPKKEGMLRQVEKSKTKIQVTESQVGQGQAAQKQKLDNLQKKTRKTIADGLLARNEF